jgi:hypothetical protein
LGFDRTASIVFLRGLTGGRYRRRWAARAAAIFDDSVVFGGGMHDDERQRTSVISGGGMNGDDNRFLEQWLFADGRALAAEYPAILRRLHMGGSALKRIGQKGIARLGVCYQSPTLFRKHSLVEKIEVSESHPANGFWDCNVTSLFPMDFPFCIISSPPKPCNNICNFLAHLLRKSKTTH